MNNESVILPEELELIEDYLMNKLTASQQEEFDQRLKSDIVLQEKVKEVKSIMTGIEQAVRLEKVEEWHSKMINLDLNTKPTIASPPVLAINYRVWLIAATILVCVAGIWIMFFSKSKQEQLFARYYKPDYGLVTPMSATDNYAFNKAMIDYKSGNYQLAINEWQQQLSQRPASDTLYYFVGSAYLAMHNYEQAAANFKKTIAIPGSTFSGEANWYLGLSELQLGNQKEAAVYIQKSTHQKREALLKDLAQ